MKGVTKSKIVCFVTFKAFYLSYLDTGTQGLNNKLVIPKGTVVACR